MDPLPPPIAFVVLLFAGWINRQQQAVIDYLLEENRVLRAAHGRRRLHLTDDQRRRLADFFTVEVVTLQGLVRYVVFFVMRLKTRTVEIAGITCQPDEAWMMQVARNLTDAGDGFLRGVQYVILDGDPLYTAAFRRRLRDSGVKPLVLPAWSPNLNAFAERFVESIKSECLDRLVLLGEGHLRAAVRGFTNHYHEERPHQGLGNELIAPTAGVIGAGQITCRERLGGLLKFYYREAA